jgi:hypothetical protein
MPEDYACHYAKHSRWSEPGGFGSRLDELPSDPARLPGIVGGLVLHPLFAGAEGNARASDAAIRTIVGIIGAILARDGRPLSEARAPAQRALGTCRTYALLACSIMRQHHLPARLRVGFADYFTPGFFEDHWVCEYHDGLRYRLLDAELTADACRRFAIDFNPADVPRGRFVAAAQAWRMIRRGDRVADCFGVSVFGLTGAWFVAASLLRDLAALTAEEMMPWDYWGPARSFNPQTGVANDWLEQLDHLAGALACEPASYDAAQAILAEHPWAALTPTILSFPAREPVEVRLEDAC